MNLHSFLLFCCELFVSLDFFSSYSLKSNLGCGVISFFLKFSCFKGIKCMGGVIALKLEHTQCIYSAHVFVNVYVNIII